MVIFLSLTNSYLYGQLVNDSSSYFINNDIDNMLEDMAAANDGAQDYSDLLDSYRELLKNPVDINQLSGLKILLENRIINESELFSLETYIKQNGPFLSKNELFYVKGLSKGAIKRLEYFTKIGKQNISISRNIGFKPLRQEFFFKGSQLFPKRQGYFLSPNEAWKKPGSIYLGTPQQLYLRYKIKGGKNWQSGFTIEKDAGEVFFNRSFGDSVFSILGKKPVFPDFYSGYIFYSGNGWLKKAVIGDFHVEIGQGLTLWTGLAFGKSSQTCQIRYFGKGIKPNTSVNENRFFRGAAVTLQKMGFQIMGFFSRKGFDANVIGVNAQQNLIISSLQQTGYHRTINELLDKNAVLISNIGGSIQFSHKNFTIGSVYYKTKLSAIMQKNINPYGKYYFSGDHLENSGLYFSWNLNIASFFGEIAVNPGVSESISGIVGMNTFFSSRFGLSVLYRNYSKHYQSLFSNPFGVNGRGQNEEGIYIGVKALLSGSLTLALYADYYKFPWLKYLKDFSSIGRAYLIQFDDIQNESLSFVFRFRYKSFSQNIKPENLWHAIPGYGERYEFRLGMIKVLNAPFILKSRIEGVNFSFNKKIEWGFLIYQNVVYKRPESPFSLTFRITYFNTQGWNSRIYAYENNVPYTFSIPTFYGKGSQVFLLSSWKINRGLKIWIRGSTTIFLDKKTIGSGPAMIQGNKKASVILALRYQF